VVRSLQACSADRRVELSRHSRAVIQEHEHLRRRVAASYIDAALTVNGSCGEQRRSTSLSCAPTASRDRATQVPNKKLITSSQFSS